ncbi:MAG TPA: CDP-alcohol phosphatidyltransferase family protein [Acidimicrobiales bacterium]|nr:CDP-alcohol phosphatidyltransferase family protein [Acidimicrobiales bacterium]
MIDGRRGKKTESDTAAPAPRPRRTIGQRLVAIGVGADAVTTIGVLLAAATAVFIAYHWFIVSVALIIVGGLMDTLDGHVAKAAGTASARGAFLDSVADRVADSLIFGGLAWYFIRAHDANAALVPLGILAVSNLVSYQRAKAESLGFSAQGGMMERAERLIFLGVTLFIAFFAPAALVPLLLALLTLTLVTCVGRFGRVWAQATAAAPAARRPGALLSGGGRAWRVRPRADQSRRGRRDLVPLSTRLRVVFGASGERESRRRERPGRHREARAFGRRFDSDR